MEAIGNYVVLEEILESSTKTQGGLELAEKHRKILGIVKQISCHLGQIF